MIIKNVKNQSVGLFCLFWFFKFYLFIYFVKNGTLRTPNMEAVLQFSSFPTVTFCMFLRPCLYPLSYDPLLQGTRLYPLEDLGSLFVSCSILKGPAYPVMVCPTPCPLRSLITALAFISPLSSDLDFGLCYLLELFHLKRKISLASPVLQFFPLLFQYSFPIPRHFTFVSI